MLPAFMMPTVTSSKSPTHTVVSSKNSSFSSRIGFICTGKLYTATGGTLGMKLFGAMPVLIAIDMSLTSDTTLR